MADTDVLDVEIEAEHSAGALESAQELLVPAAGFDLLEGKGRAVVATQKLNRTVSFVCLFVLILAALWTARTLQTHGSIVEQRDALQSRVSQLNAELLTAARTSLDENALIAHRDARQELLFQIYEPQRPYQSIFDDLVATARPYGICLDPDSFQVGGAVDAFRIEVNGETPLGIDSYGLWTIEVQERLGTEFPGGYVQELRGGYSVEVGEGGGASVCQQNIDNGVPLPIQAEQIFRDGPPDRAQLFSVEITGNVSARAQAQQCHALRNFLVEGPSVGMTAPAQSCADFIQALSDRVDALEEELGTQALWDHDGNAFTNRLPIELVIRDASGAVVERNFDLVSQFPLAIAPDFDPNVTVNPNACAGIIGCDDEVGT